MHTYIHLLKLPLQGFSVTNVKIKKQDKGKNVIIYMKQKPNEINYITEI